MWIVVVPAAVLTLATLLLALLWRGALALAGKAAPGYFGRMLRWHALLLLVHLFATVPLALGFFARVVSTRGDERAWKGPRIASDGSWLVQTRETLAEERAHREARESGHAAAAERATIDAEIAHLAELDERAAASAVSFEARDGVKLRAFLVPPRDAPAPPPAFMAVLVHGLYRGGLELEPVGAMLRDLGGEVLLLELRNHGGSGRAHATFGQDESLDVLAAVDFVRARPEAAGRPLLLYAVSIGTAAAAIAAPELTKKGELAGLVLDAPLDEIRATADRMLAAGGGGRRGPGVPQPFRAIALWSAEHLAGAPLSQVRPCDALRRLPPTLPVLFIAAGHDERMPPAQVHALFESLPTADDRKELWIVPQAEHGKVWVAEPEAYREHLARFVEKLAKP